MTPDEYVTNLYEKEIQEVRDNFLDLFNTALAIEQSEQEQQQAENSSESIFL